MSEQNLHTRRDFLNRGLAMISASATVPLFLDRTAWAFFDPAGAPQGKKKTVAKDDRILVVLQLAGGNDGLNTVIPYRNDRYYKGRPRIAVPKSEALKLTDELGLHPKATGLKSLYDAGLLAVLQGVGYPNPNRSHFVATDIWASGDPRDRMRNGWIGRYLDCTCKGHDKPDPKRGIAMTSEQPLAMTGEKFSPVTFSSPQELSWRGAGADSAGRDAFEKFNEESKESRLSAEHPRSQAEALAYLKRTAMDARFNAREIQKAAGSSAGRDPVGLTRAKGRRSGQLGQQLTMVRRMIASGLDTKVYYVSMTGFDTHAGQTGRHQALMEQLGDAVNEFVEGLKEDGLLDRVLLMTFSEFGRRVNENASQGTDHGTAAPLFVVGGSIRPGVHGAHPSLEPDKLDNGDLKWQTDFRCVYSAILGNWLQADAKRILGGEFKPHALFR